MSERPDNRLEFFKESSDDPFFSEHKGQGKIFLHHLCAEAPVSRKYYSMHTINQAFEQNQNTEHFLGKITSMIYALQQAVTHGLEDSPLGRYEYAQKDYPQLYETIVKNISEGALQEMERRQQDYGLTVHPSNLGKITAEQLRADRAKFLGAGRINMTRVNGGRGG